MQKAAKASSNSKVLLSQGEWPPRHQAGRGQATQHMQGTIWHNSEAPVVLSETSQSPPSRTRDIVGEEEETGQEVHLPSWLGWPCCQAAAWEGEQFSQVVWESG